MTDQTPLPLSEQYRVKAIAWVNLNAAANLLEDCKSAVLAQRMAELGDMPVSRAETQVKASPEWGDYISAMTEARKQAELARVEVEFLKMRFSEWQSDEANKRTEARL